MADGGNNNLPDPSDVRDIAANLADAAQAAQEMQKHFRRSNQDIVNLDQILEHIVRNARDLPEGILTAADLQKRLTTDAELFKEVQEEALNIGLQQIDEWYEVAVDKAAENLKISLEQLDVAEQFLLRAAEEAKTEDELLAVAVQQARVEEQKQALSIRNEREILSILEAKLDLEKEIIPQLERQFEILERDLKTKEAANEEMFDTKKTIESLSSALQEPRKAFDGFLGSLSQVPKKFVKLRAEGKGVGEALSGAFNLGKLAKYAKFLANPVVAAIVAVTAVAVIMFKLFSSFYDFLEKKVMPTIAGVNKEFGNMGKATQDVKKFALATGDQFELMGMSFEQGAQAATDVAAAMKTIAFQPGQLETALKLSEYVGLGAEQTGKLVNAFVKTGSSLDGLNESMDAATELGSEFGVSAQSIRKELGQNVDLIHRFGTANTMELTKSIAKWQQLGLAAKDVEAAFGKQMDTFEGTAESSAKLNTIFGTNINSMELMMAKSPEKRMELVRKELEKQGKTFDKLDVFQQNVITSTLGVTRENAALMLSSDKARKKLKKEAKQKERNAKADKDWKKGLQNLTKTLLPWSKLLELTMRATTKLVAAVFGFDKPGKMFANITKKIKGFMLGKDGLISTITRVAKAWREGGGELPPFMKRLKFVISGFMLFHRVITLPIKILGFLIGKLIDLWSWFGKVTGITGLFNDAIEVVSDVMNDLSNLMDSFTFESLMENSEKALMAIGGFFKKYLYEKPKEVINDLIQWLALPESMTKILDLLNPISTLSSLFSGDGDSVPKPEAKATPTQAKTKAKKRASSPSNRRKGKDDDLQVTLVIEGTDELSEVLAKIISVKQVERSRRG